MFKLFKITKDTYISQRLPNNNQGRSAQLYINSGSHNQGTKLDPHEDKRTLVQFNESDIIDDIGSGNIEDYEFNLRFFISDLRLVYNDFSVSAHPLTTSWDEGIGEEFQTNIGATWEHSGVQSQYTFDESEGFEFVGDADLVDWTNVGGDYDNTTTYSSSIDRNKMILETDISDFVYSINSGSSNNGLIYIADDVNYNMALYSSNSLSELNPVVVAYNDDYTISGSAVEFTGENMDIKPLHYNRLVEEGEQFNMIIDIESQYRVSGFTYGRELKYVENLKYKIVYKTSDYELIPYSEYTRVPVKGEGLTVNFSTEYFPKGAYYIKFMHEQNGVKNYSDKFYFRVD